ncbi:MAG: hypothetical protein OEO19_00800 [Gammaproteobacteria bacterium]|nr:hypothetical protein [Gammaproteobacteria bacterium]MDH3446551.1 hypothetical protein [Gammaproteobacteria bacterium]
MSRFVARAAVARALGTGIGERFGLHSVQVDHDDQGRPVLSFRAHAADLIAELGIGNAMISLSIELIVTIFRK